MTQCYDSSFQTETHRVSGSTSLNCLSLGLDQEERTRLVDMLGPRIRSMYKLLRFGHETGVGPWCQLWSEGHGTIWLADALYIDIRRSTWTKALGIGADSTD
jgi:hypothetical protein